MDSKEINFKKSMKHSACPMADQQYKSFHSKSKDKLLNGKASCTIHRTKNCSKVPRMVRIPIKCNANKNTVRMGGKLDDSAVNLKPSHIPRRKATVKDNVAKESSPKKNHPFLGDSRNTRNVQRIQLLINQDYRPEARVPAASVATTRPIPTLGQIYARNNLVDTDRLDDWFGELDTPANSMASNFFSISSRLVDVRATAEDSEYIATTNKYRTTTVSNLEFDGASYQSNAYRTTDENVSDWLSTDVEYPTRDNESGYRSISPPTHTPMDIKSKHSKCSFVSAKVENKSENNEQQLSESSSRRSIQDCLDNESTATTLREQPTVVLATITSTSINHKTGSSSNQSKEEDYRHFYETGPDSKNCQYPSRTIFEPTQEVHNQVTVPSYVECLSEILQKTTNFEGYDMVLPISDSPNTLSSIAGTDLEIRDDLSSQYVMEHEDCSLDGHCSVEWCPKCRSCEKYDKSHNSEDTSVLDSLICQYNDDLVDASLVKGSDNDYVDHWKRHHGDVKRHCKKFERYRRFPSTRYKLPKTLSSLRRRMSLRICRRRLSRVWKKTTERWAMWSAKSPHKFKKLRVMQYLQRAILWEDVDVQTNIFVYRETGTEPTMKEQKSAAVSTILKFGSSSLSYRNGSVMTATPSRINTSTFRHINLGPSMFPFIYNSKKSSFAKQGFQERRNSIGKEDKFNISKSNAMSQETQKTTNHVITQTFSNLYSTDKSDIKPNDDKTGLVVESENYIEICEVCTDDKVTGTEDMSPMKDNVTSTVLHLDAIRQMSNWESQNAHTQMLIVCNNAETDVKFPPTRGSNAASVLTSMSEDIVLHRPCETNTDLKSLKSINIMTSTELLKCSSTFNHIGTQVTPVPSLRKISTGIFTSKSFAEKNSTKIDTSTGMNDEIENNLKDFSNQVIPQQPSLMCSVNKSTSTRVEVQEAYAVMSREEFDSPAEVSTNNAWMKNSVPLDSPPLQVCQCPHVDITSRGTDTNDAKYRTTSTNKLKTYFNTGMLINTLVEGAIMPREAKTSISTDTKSIGNECTSDIATSTNSELKGLIIEKEKARYPKRLSVDTSTFLEQESKSTDQYGADWLRADWLRSDSAASRNKTDNCTQYSYIAQKETISCRAEHIGNSRLISVRMLTHPPEETGAQTEPLRIHDGVLYMPRQYKCTSVFTSQCALDQPMKQTTLNPEDFDHANDGLSSSPVISRKKINSSRNSSFRRNTSEVLSSDLDADKWIKSCIEKGYQSQLNVESSLNENKNISASDSSGSKIPGDKKSDSKSVGSNTRSVSQLIVNNITTVASAITDMAIEKYDKDLVPMKDTCEKQIVKMVDNVTSDEVVKKEVKEITLQASPENCEAATDCSKPTETKSACVFTSRYILPTPCSCQMNNCGLLSGECLFVYGKPKCVVHSKEEYTTASAQMSFSRQRPEVLPLSTQTPSDSIYHDHYLRSVGMLTSYCTTSACHEQSSKIADILSPKVYKALYETTKQMYKEEPKLTDIKNDCIYCDVDAEHANMCPAAEIKSVLLASQPARPPHHQSHHIEEMETALLGAPLRRSTSMVASPDVHSAAVLTSQCGYRSSVQQSDQFTQNDLIFTFASGTRYNFLEKRNEEDSTQTSYDNPNARKLEIPTHDDDPDCVEECAKTHLVASCRYYSTLLTKQLDKVRENLTKHLTSTPNTNFTNEVPNLYTEACTMKPSAREELGCQTCKNQPCHGGSKFPTTLSPAVSSTDICQHDKEHLKSVYYMLTAIEGRLRRFKTNID